MIKNKCKLFRECKQAGKETCNEMCWKYIQLDFQYAQSNIPKGYLKPINMDLNHGSVVDRESYIRLNNYKKDVYKNVKIYGEGAYIYGKNKGNGKTSWAIKIMQEYFRQLHRTIQTFEEAKGLYVNVPILFKMSKDNISNPSDEFKTLERRITESDLVIFDDIGTEAPTKWVKENLYIYITEREMQNRASIYTSNLTLKELENEDRSLGERIVDRIYKQVGSNIIELKGPSRRRKY